MKFSSSDVNANPATHYGITCVAMWMNALDLDRSAEMERVRTRPEAINVTATKGSSLVPTMTVLVSFKLTSLKTDQVFSKQLLTRFGE